MGKIVTVAKLVHSVMTPSSDANRATVTTSVLVHPTLFVTSILVNVLARATLEAANVLSVQMVTSISQRARNATVTPVE